MKVLVIYFSQSGNTKKLAEAIFEGIELTNKDISPVKGVDPIKINDYDLVFVGSPIISFDFAKPLKRILKKIPELKTSFALFCTHAAPIDYPQYWKEGFKKYGQELEKKGGKILGYFDTQGEQTPVTKQFVKEWNPEYAPKAIEASDGHPNEEDMTAAKKFAGEIIKKYYN